MNNVFERWPWCRKSKEELNFTSIEADNLKVLQWSKIDLYFFIFFRYIKSTPVIKILTMQKSLRPREKWLIKPQFLSRRLASTKFKYGGERWDRRGNDIIQSRQQKHNGYFLVAKLKLKLKSKLVMQQYTRWMDHTDCVYFCSSCEWELIGWHHKTHREIQCTGD